MAVTKIASIHYKTLTADRSIYRGYYEIPGVPLDGKPVIIDLVDRVQRDEGAYELGSGGKRAQLQYPVWGQQIAQDLVREWAQSGLGMTPDCHPGVWVVRNSLPTMELDASGTPRIVMDVLNMQVFHPATAEETAQMWQEDLAHAKMADRNYAEWCFREGNGWAADARKIPYIPKNYIMAARHYGFEAPWTKEQTTSQIAPCIYCTTPIPKSSVVCPKCQQVVNVEAFAMLEARKEAAMRAAKKAVLDEERTGIPAVPKSSVTPIHAAL